MTAIDGYIGLLHLCNAEEYDISLADMQRRWLEALYELLSNDNYIRKCMSSATEERYNHNHDPHTGRFTSGDSVNTVDNTGESGIIKLNDIEIGKSLSAKAKNYNIKDLQTGEVFHFAEGTKIQDVKAFAGKGTKTPFRKADKYAERYGGNSSDWQHCKGKGVVDYYGENRKAEVHWVQCEGIGKHEFFVKEWLD